MPGAREPPVRAWSGRQREAPRPHRFVPLKRQAHGWTRGRRASHCPRPLVPKSIPARSSPSEIVASAPVSRKATPRTISSATAMSQYFRTGRRGSLTSADSAEWEGSGVGLDTPQPWSTRARSTSRSRAIPSSPGWGIALSVDDLRALLPLGFGLSGRRPRQCSTSTNGMIRRGTGPRSATTRPESVGMTPRATVGPINPKAADVQPRCFAAAGYDAPRQRQGSRRSRVLWLGRSGCWRCPRACGSRWRIPGGTQRRGLARCLPAVGPGRCRSVRPCHEHVTFRRLRIAFECLKAWLRWRNPFGGQGIP